MLRRHRSGKRVFGTCRIPARFARIALVVALAASHVAIAQEKHALLIGLNTSSANDVPTLKFAVKDAEKVRELLLKQPGFQKKNIVALIESEATRMNIVRELMHFAHSVKATDTFVLYFAGHGVTYKFPGGREHTYWLGRHASFNNLDVEGIRLSQVLNYLADIPAQRKFVILDHCFSGEVVVQLAEGGGRSIVGPARLERKLERVQPIYEKALTGENLVLIGAAREIAYEYTDLEHGLLTYALVQTLLSPPDGMSDDGIGARELAAHLKRQVKALSGVKHVKQLPLTWSQGTEVDDWPLFEPSAKADPAALKEFLMGLLIAGLDTEDVIWATQVIDRWSESVEAGIDPTQKDDKVVDFVHRHMGLRDLDELNVTKFGDNLDILRNAFEEDT